MNAQMQEWILNNKVNDKIDRKLYLALREKDISIRLTAIPLRNGDNALTAKITASHDWLDPYIQEIELGTLKTYKEMNRTLAEKLGKLFRLADGNGIGAAIMSKAVKTYLEDGCEIDAELYEAIVQFAADIEDRFHAVAENLKNLYEKDITAKAA